MHASPPRSHEIGGPDLSKFRSDLSTKAPHRCSRNRGKLALRFRILWKLEVRAYGARFLWGRELEHLPDWRGSLVQADLLAFNRNAEGV